MSRFKRLKLNPRLLFIGRALVEIKTLNAIIVLFYLHREVAIDEIFYLSVVFSAAMLLFEVPSGYLADRFGRKRTLLLGAFFFLAVNVSLFFAHGFGQFIWIFILMAAANASFSGTEEAMLFDTLKELKREKKMTEYYGKLHSARNFTKVFLPSIGALIAKELLESQFQILISFNVIAIISSFLILLFLMEPKHEKDVLAREKGIYMESIATIRRNPFLFRAAMNKAIIFVAGFAIWRAYQPFLIEHGISVIWLGVLYFGFHAISFVFKWYLGPLEKRFGVVKLLRWSTIGIVIMMLGTITFTIPWVLFLLLMTTFVFTGSRIPLFAYAMNKHISSRSRSTTLSNLNFIIAVLQIPGMLIAGWMAKTNIELVFVFGLILAVIVLIWFPVREKDLAAPAFAELEAVD